MADFPEQPKKQDVEATLDAARTQPRVGVGPPPQQNATAGPQTGGPVSPQVAAARAQVAAPFADERPGTAAAVAAQEDEELKRLMAERQAYITSMRNGEISRNDYRPPQPTVGENGEAIPPQEMVRIRGTDSNPTAGVKAGGNEGHIMATQMTPTEAGGAQPGAHFSFYPAHQNVRDAREGAGTPTERTAVGVGKAPFPASTPMNVPGTPGALAPEAEDHYLYGKGADGQKTTKEQHFDHAFDPRFIDPKRFAEETARAQARQAALASPAGQVDARADARLAQEANPDLFGRGVAELPDELAGSLRADATKQIQKEQPERVAGARDSEFRLATVPATGPVGARAEKNSDGKVTNPDEMRMGPSKDLAATDPRITDFVPPEGGAAQPTVQARNCGTELLGVMRQMGVLNQQDLIMLGADKKGNFAPGFDITPQQLNEHLRWREHMFLENARRQEEAAKAGGAPPPPGGGDTTQRPPVPPAAPPTPVQAQPPEAPQQRPRLPS